MFTLLQEILFHPLRRIFSIDHNEVSSSNHNKKQSLLELILFSPSFIKVKDIMHETSSNKKNIRILLPLLELNESFCRIVVLLLRKEQLRMDTIALDRNVEKYTVTKTNNIISHCLSHTHHSWNTKRIQ